MTAIPKSCPRPVGIVVTRAFVDALMTDTDLSNWLMTYTRVPAAFTATPVGFAPTGTVATVLVAVSITETVLLKKLATYTRVPLGFTATPKGRSPTVTFMTRGRVAVGSTTDTLLDMKFEMYANGAAAAADATASDSASKATRIPETRLVPENPLGSGHLVFMPPR